MQGELPETCDIQTGLNKLARMPPFPAILKTVVRARKLDINDVRSCVGHLYAKVCKCTNGNDCTWEMAVIVRVMEFEDNELAALVTFLKAQSQLLVALRWVEDASCKEDQ